MKHLLTTALTAMLCLGTTPAMSQTQKVKLKVVETSDIHGHFFPYDFIERKPLMGTLARVSTYVERQRKEYATHVIADRLYTAYLDLVAGASSGF